MWRERGFRPLPGGQAREWAQQLPGFPERKQAKGDNNVLLSKRMAAAEEEGGDERHGLLRRALGGVVGGMGSAVRGVIGYVLLWNR